MGSMDEIIHISTAVVHESGEFTPHERYELNKLTSLPMWLHSSVGRASHRYRGGHGFESR